jgi:hypothetical protein
VKPNSRLPTLALVTVTVAVFAVFAACATEPPPLEPPALAESAKRYFGSSLSGPRIVASPADLAFDDATAIRVRARVRWFATVPEHSLTPIDDRIDRIVDQHNASTLYAAVRLTAAVWVGAGDEAVAAFETLSREERSVELTTIESILAPGVTMVLPSAGRATIEEPSEGARHSSVEVSYAVLGSDVPLRIALVVQGYVPSNSVTTPDLLEERREVVLLRDAPAIDGKPIVLLFAPRANDRTDAFLVLLDAVAASTPALSEAEREVIAGELRACASECALNGAIAATGPSPDPLAGIATLERDHRRGAIARLAILTAARITLAVATAADDDMLDLLVAKLAEGRTGPVAGENIGLTLERTTWKFLADQMSGTGFPDALAAIAVEYAGEAGRFAAVIDDVATSARSLEEIDARFVAQNRSLLEDRSPSSRVRAFEWLTARGIAPAGFDPLGPLAERKKALRAAEDIEAAAFEAAAGEAK